MVPRNGSMNSNIYCQGFLKQHSCLERQIQSAESFQSRTPSTADSSCSRRVPGSEPWTAVMTHCCSRWSTWAVRTAYAQLLHPAKTNSLWYNPHAMKAVMFREEMIQLRGSCSDCSLLNCTVFDFLMFSEHWCNGVDTQYCCTVALLDYVSFSLPL